MEICTFSYDINIYLGKFIKNQTQLLKLDLTGTDTSTKKGRDCYLGISKGLRFCL